MTQTMKGDVSQAQAACERLMGLSQAVRQQGAQVSIWEPLGGFQAAYQRGRKGEPADRCKRLGRGVDDFTTGQLDALIHDMNLTIDQVNVPPAQAADLTTAQAEQQHEQQRQAVGVVVQGAKVDHHFLIAPRLRGRLMVLGLGDFVHGVASFPVLERALEHHPHHFRGSLVATVQDTRQQVAHVQGLEIFKGDPAQDREHVEPQQAFVGLDRPWL